jgi:hypothetical protein
MPRKGNVVVGKLEEVGESTIKVENVVYKVAEKPQAFLKRYKPGQQVYLDLRNETVTFMMEYEAWKAKFPTKAQASAMNSFAEKVEESANKIAAIVPNRGSSSDDLRIMQSAAACATGLVKSMIERGWFGAVNDDTAMDKVRPTMNQLMIAIYTDQKQILGSDV